MSKPKAPGEQEGARRATENLDRERVAQREADWNQRADEADTKEAQAPSDA